MVLFRVLLQSVSAIVCVHAALDVYSCLKAHATVPKRESIEFLNSLLLPLTNEKFLAEIVQRQPAVLSKQQSSYFNHLLGFEDIDDMIENGRKSNDPSLRILHGEDWKVAKRVFAKGKWHTGVMPMKENMTLSLAKDAFLRGGFSIIIDSVESLSPNVHVAAKLLEDALGWRVRVNMYLSPPHSQGFEAHFDWMDGLVVQLRGAKHWTLYAPLMVEFPRPDQMVTPEEVGFLLEPSTAADHFTLKAGDVAYIPRGAVHEATTRVIDGDGVSSAPEGDIVEGGEASLHLTFGLETATHHSTEVFLHHLVAEHSSLLVLRPGAFSSDDGHFEFHCGSDLAVYGSGTVEDCVHVVLAAVASTEAGALLRRAVGVTVAAVDMPGLDPIVLVPHAIDAAIDLVDLGLIVDFLIHRDMMRIVPPACHGVSGTPVSSSGCGVQSRESVGGGRDGTHHLSADRSCNYLNKFVSEHFVFSNRTLFVSANAVSDIGSHTSTNMDSIRRASWVEATSAIKKLLTMALTGGSLVNYDDNNSFARSFCAAWEGMIAYIRADREDRLRMDTAALVASGHSLPPDR